ncbi:LysR family transcriptional regulator [Methylosinus sp. H3A]|uniref:LysR family transcriptional regulator n=1 Tax=Methylosinus sp. H3A TaxID=2785786 RepID=UPI0018C29B3C|nr:LysR family transcriptional regulator [Methylosinus sp. H3A]MBG0807897.1 LysR family transcriptional regulator [Methylosinus sp. H3A]
MSDLQNDRARSDAIMGDRRITLEHLRAFVAVSDHGGFQRAGNELARSQSAITQGLKRLEDILRCVLVVRDRGHFAGLTEDGHRFIGPAREILVKLNDTVGIMRQQDASDRIALGVLDDFEVEHLNSLVARSVESNSNLRVEVVSGLSEQLKEQFSRGALDIVLYKDMAEDNRVGCECNMRVIREEPLLWVARERYRFDPSCELPLVTFPDGCAYRRAAIQSLETTGVKYSIAYSSASYENVRSAISARLGVGILPKSAVGPDHAIMSKDVGLPTVPNIRLVLAIRNGSARFDRFAGVLHKMLTGPK